MLALNFLNKLIAQSSSLPDHSSPYLELAIEQYSYTPIFKQPITIIGFGALITLIFGFIFAKVMQRKLQDWESKKISPLPFASPKTLISWSGAFIGFSIFFSGMLNLLDFSFSNSIKVAIIISLFTAISMWLLINDLMIQLEAGRIKEFDEYL